MSEFS